MIYMSSSSTGDGSLAITVTLRTGHRRQPGAGAGAEPRRRPPSRACPSEVRQIGVTVRKNSPDILLVVAFYSPDKSLSQQYISNYATLQVIDRLKRIQGVGGVRIFGGRDYIMRIWIDPDLAATRNLTVDEVVAAIRAQNAQVAAGSIGQPPFNQGGNAFQLGIQAIGPADHARPVRRHHRQARRRGRLTRLRDVARIELGAQDYSINAHAQRQADRPRLAITQLPGSNALATADSCEGRDWRDAAKSFPAGHDLQDPL